MNIFLVGAGGLGNEILKGLALMGVSTDGQAVVTDMKIIKKPNVSTHFLCRYRRRRGEVSKSEEV